VGARDGNKGGVPSAQYNCNFYKKLSPGAGHGDTFDREGEIRGQAQRPFGQTLEIFTLVKRQRQRQIFTLVIMKE